MGFDKILVSPAKFSGVYLVISNVLLPLEAGEYINLAGSSCCNGRSTRILSPYLIKVIFYRIFD